MSLCNFFISIIVNQIKVAFVGNLPANATEEYLKNLFEKFGKVSTFLQKHFFTCLSDSRFIQVTCFINTLGKVKMSVLDVHPDNVILKQAQLRSCRISNVICTIYSMQFV